ncbi:MAG: tetratricopeptide repeat protein [Deltaproteobacteria bacterium]|nr:tetratricopeptide repeat protein [Deltaproteobacteria bacterium]
MAERDSTPKFDFLAVVLLSVSAVAVYCNTLSAGFVFDDYLHIVDNPNIRSISSSLIYFQEPLPPGNLYRPLLLLSYALSWRAAEGAAWFFHGGNVLLHAANLVMLYLLLGKLVERRMALLAALILAVHPTPSEAVANISGRSELLAVFFGAAFLLSALAALGKCAGSGRLKWELAAALCLLLALLSKESGLSFLLLLLVFIWHSGPGQLRAFAFSRLAVLSVIASGAYAALRLSALGPSAATGGEISFLDNPLAHLSIKERILNASYLLTNYIVLIVFPHRQSADYSFAQFYPLSPVLRNMEIGQVLSIAIPFLLLLVGGLRARRRDPLGALILWFFSAFSITGNIFFPIGTVFADRLAYLATPSVAAAVLLMLSRSFGSGPATVSGVAAFAACAMLTFSHNPVWHNNLSLWTHQMKVAPFSFKAKANYGAALYENGRLDEAKRYLEESLAIESGSPGTYRVLGQVYSALEETEDAGMAFRDALAIDPNNPVTLKAYKEFREKHPEPLTQTEAPSGRPSKISSSAPRDLEALGPP